MNEHVLTPVQLEVLIHHYYQRGPFHSTSPAHTAAAGDLCRLELMQFQCLRKIGEFDDYLVTNRGQAHVQALCAVKLPELRSVWVSESQRVEVNA